jgi:hypothetical protein
MDGYKRNQVGEAISRLSEPGANAPSASLETKLKRLLERDRALGRSPRSSDTERANYAFFSAEAPGSGVEIWFSGYEAFALYTALRLFEHGWPQTGAVTTLRRARPKLEPKHAEILRWDAASLFDEELVHKSAKPGMLATSTTRPVFLSIASRQGRPKDREPDDTREVEILEESEVLPFLRREAGLSVTNFELVSAAHNLNRALLKTTPTSRGRGAADQSASRSS